MMKNILIKCAEILNRNDIISTLKQVNSINEISDYNIQSDVIKLISYYNYITQTIYQEYFDLIITEHVSSDDTIHLKSFLFKMKTIIYILQKFTVDIF